MIHHAKFVPPKMSFIFSDRIERRWELTANSAEALTKR